MIPKEKGELREERAQTKISSKTYRFKKMFMQFRFQLWQWNLWSNYVRLQSVWVKAILRRIGLIISQWTFIWLFSATLLNNWRFIKSLIQMIMILLSNIDQKNEASNVLEASTSFPDKYIWAKATLWISFSVNELPNYIDLKKNRETILVICLFISLLKWSWKRVNEFCSICDWMPENEQKRSLFEIFNIHLVKKERSLVLRNLNYI